jgi:hypothetical protein
MCTLSEPAVPSSTAQALAMLHASLGYLTSCDAAELGTSVQAEALIGLEQAEAQHTAARAKMLAAFSAQQGHQADGQYGPAAWLRAFTHITNGAAGSAVKWARRLAAHPLIAAALGAGQLSVSWARALCEWTDQLPEDRRADADAILLAAAHGGAELGDLAALAQQMIERSRTAPDRDKGTFDDRAVWLETTIGGAGRLTGDLTGPAAAAVAVVLDALSGRGGAEDTRTLPQRQHDGLAEACQRLIDSGMLPGHDSQPVQLTVHVDLAELNRLPGASELEAGFSTARAAAAGLPGSVHLTGPDAGAAACDAALIPVVTGHIDWAILDHLTSLVLQHASHHDSQDPAPGQGQDTDPGQGQDTDPGQGQDADPGRGQDTDPGRGQDTDPGRGQDTDPGQGQDTDPGRDQDAGAGQDTDPGQGQDTDPAPGQDTGPETGRGGAAEAAPDGPDEPTSPSGTGCPCPVPHRTGPVPLSPATRERLQHTLLHWSIDLLSGPAGFPAHLRTHLLPARFTSLSQPLDLGRTTRTVPPHLRKAVIQRDKKCRFPGCQQPPSVCQVHHLIPWAQGGATALGNLAMLCRYHHIIVIHRWGWKITCHPDGTTTATSPDGRTLHSHGPPTAAA